MLALLQSRGKSLGFLALLGLSLVGWYVAYANGLTTVYNDAMSHLDVARLVIDNRQTGLSQLGSVWLPLSQLLYLPFVWNAWLWHTGIAGSIVSMAAFVLSGMGVYALTSELTTSRLGSLIATAAFTLNLNALYLQSTPLTEMLFVMLFVASCLFLVKYLKSGSSKALIALSFVMALSVLTRYDGWFMAGVAAIIIMINEIWLLKHSLRHSFGILGLYVAPVAFAALLWFGWNLIIFHDALYAFTGPYSAHAQQAIIASHSGLLAKNSLGQSVRIFLLDMRDNIGLGVLLAGFVGWVVYLFTGARKQLPVRALVLSMLASVIVFNILALLLGFSIINLPELGWNPSGTPEGLLFNVRYGVLALPFIAVGLGVLASRRRVAATLLVVLIGVQAVVMYHGGIITVADGQHGSSAFRNRDIAMQMQHYVGKNDTVLMSTSAFNAVAFQSGLNLHQFIHEGVSGEWNSALADPKPHAKWIVMAKGSVGEPVYSSLISKEHGAFLKSYTLVYSGAHANLYELKS